MDSNTRKKPMSRYNSPDSTVRLNTALNTALIKQESLADAVKPARRKSMQKLLQFDVFRFISPNSISPNFKV